MEAYHFRSYKILLVLDIFIDAKARISDDYGNDILVVSFFAMENSCWLQKDIFIDSISFRKL